MTQDEIQEAILQVCKVSGNDSDFNVVRFYTLCDRLVELGAAEGRNYRAMYLKVRDELAELQQREWQGLTDEEVKTAWSQLWYDLNNGKFAASDDPSRHNTVMFARAIEAKLKEKNCG